MCDMPDKMWGVLEEYIANGKGKGWNDAWEQAGDGPAESAGKPA